MPGSGEFGQLVIINGSGFTGATVVEFDGLSTLFTVDDDGTITAEVPFLDEVDGLVDVTVTTPAGSDTLEDGFFYVGAV